VRRSWLETRADALADIAAAAARRVAREVDAATKRAGTLFPRTPARRAGWLARRLARARAHWEAVADTERAALDTPAATELHPNGPGVYWRAVRVNHATGSVVDARGVVCVRLAVTGPEAVQAAALRALWALAAEVDALPGAGDVSGNARSRKHPAPLHLAPDDAS